MRDSLKSAHGKKKKRKGKVYRVHRLQLSMDQLKRMHSNSAERGGLSKTIFAMDDRTTFVCFMIRSTCHSDKVSIKKQKNNTLLLSISEQHDRAVCNECEAAVYCRQAMFK